MFSRFVLLIRVILLNLLHSFNRSRESEEQFEPISMMSWLRSAHRPESAEKLDEFIPFDCFELVVLL